MSRDINMLNAAAILALSAHRDRARLVRVAG